MTQVILSSRTAFLSSWGPVPLALRRRVAAALGDLVHGVMLAGVGLAVIGVVTSGVLFVSQWRDLPAPIVPPGQIQHR